MTSKSTKLGESQPIHVTYTTVGHIRDTLNSSIGDCSKHHCVCRPNPDQSKPLVVAAYFCEVLFAPLCLHTGRSMLAFDHRPLGRSLQRARWWLPLRY